MQVTKSVAVMQALRLCCSYAGGAFCCVYVGGSFCCNHACNCFCCNYAVRSFCSTYTSDRFCIEYVGDNFIVLMQLRVSVAIKRVFQHFCFPYRPINGRDILDF